MIGSLKARMRHLRFTMLALAAALSTALIITPARAAGDFAHLEGGEVAAVCVFGTLLFAVVYEIWQFSASKSASERLKHPRDRLPE